MTDDRVVAMQMMLDCDTECSDHGMTRDPDCRECIGAEAVSSFCLVALEVLHAEKPLEAVWYKPEEAK